MLYIYLTITGEIILNQQQIQHCGKPNKKK
jgi:hypothetical protein